MFKKREKNMFTWSEQLCNPNAKKTNVEMIDRVRMLERSMLGEFALVGAQRGANTEGWHMSLFAHRLANGDNGCEEHFSHILKQFASPAAPTRLGPASEPLNMVLIVVVKPMKRECL